MSLGVHQATNRFQTSKLCKQTKTVALFMAIRAVHSATRRDANGVPRPCEKIQTCKKMIQPWQRT